MFSKITVLESLFNKVAGLRPATLIKKRIRHRRFLVNFGKPFRTTFFLYYRAPPLATSEHTSTKANLEREYRPLPLHKN